MSSTPVIIAFLVATPPLCLLTNSWLIMWVILEINTISFCTLLSTSHQTDNNNSSESAINYLIIQSIASAVLLMYMSSHNQGILINVLFYGGISALFLNLASVPFHSWFISIINNSSWNNALILISWQNLAPIYLIIFLLSPLVLLSLILTAILGSSSQLNNKNILEILALSSIFNLSWIITAITLSFSILIYFLFFYWASLALMLMLLNSIDQTNINNESFSNHNEWTTIIILVSLAGIPPTIGFVANWNVLIGLLNQSLASLTTFLLLSSAINLYIYLRLSTNLLININQLNPSIPRPQWKNITLWLTISNVPALVTVT